MKKILLCLSFFCISMLSFNYINAVENNNSKVKLVDSTLSISNVITMLFIADIKFPEVVLSQIMIESGNLTSKKCIEDNNLLGMTVPNKRKTTAINKNGYAKYANWVDCILDYKLYQNAIMTTHNIMTRNDYINLLRKKKYATSSSYVKKLKEKSIL